MTESPARMDRRTLLRGAATLGLTAAGAGALSAAGVAGAASRALPAPLSGGAAPGPFDLRSASHPFFSGRPLTGYTVMQSFTFDNAEHRLYAVQITAEAAGNLRLTRFTPTATAHGVHWRTDGYMNLLNAGHGVSIAAHDGRLWTEADAEPDKAGAYGRRLATFRFTRNGVVDLAPGGGHPQPDAYRTPHSASRGFDQYTCAIDPANEHLIVRYSRRPAHPHQKRAHYFEAFRLDDAIAGNWKHPVYGPCAQPPIIGDFQGYTAMGRFLYLFSGTSKDVKGVERDRHGHVARTQKLYHPPRLYCYDMKAHRLVQNGVHTTAGHRMEHWEPEGMAIYLPKNSGPRLFFGFATGKPGHRGATLFYKKK